MLDFVVLTTLRSSSASMLIVHRMFVVFGLSIGKLKAVLKRKYSSFNTLSEFLVLKLAKVKVENSDDVLVLKEIL
ncbi:hypothetical protein RDWZM_001478, partial [Blomia tropicalis]